MQAKTLYYSKYQLHTCMESLIFSLPPFSLGLYSELKKYRMLCQFAHMRARGHHISKSSCHLLACMKTSNQRISQIDILPPICMLQASIQPYTISYSSCSPFFAHHKTLMCCMQHKPIFNLPSDVGLMLALYILRIVNGAL